MFRPLMQRDLLADPWASRIMFFGLIYFQPDPICILIYWLFYCLLLMLLAALHWNNVAPNIKSTTGLVANVLNTHSRLPDFC